jgi:drug/metabolite transporter (DMT)-like permease
VPSRLRAPDLAVRLRALGRDQPLAPIALGVLLYSTGPVFVQASDVSGAVFSFWRLWMGVVVFAIAILAQRARGGAAIARGAWRWPVLAGIAFGSHQLALFTAVKLTTVATVTLIGATSPVVTGLLAVPAFAERPGRRFRLWAVVAMVGAAVVVAGGASGPTGDPLGMTLAMANVVLFATFFLISKASRDHLGTLPFLGGSLTVAAVLVSAYVAVAGEPVGAAASRDLLFAAIVAAGPGFVGHVVMTWPLQWVPANIPPVMRLALPVLAGTWAWLFLGETVGWWHVVGGVVVLGGVAGAVLSRDGRELVAAERRGAGVAPATGR